MSRSLLNRSAAVWLPIVIIMVAAGPLEAQTKSPKTTPEPTAQETISYIHNWFQKNIVGKPRFNRPDVMISRVDFTGGTLEVHARGEREWFEIDRLSDINWSLALPDKHGKYVTKSWLPQSFGYVVGFSSEHIVHTASEGRPSRKETRPMEMDNHTLPFLIAPETPAQELAKLEKAVAHLVRLKKKEGTNSFFDN